MFIGLRRSILIGTVAAVAAIIVLLPLLVGLAFPLPSQLPVSISDIEVIDQNEETITLQVAFNVYNPGFGALAASKVEYDLFANDKFLGKGKLDYSDIPLNGQPQLLQRQTTTLESTIMIDLASIAKSVQPSEFFWKASGTIEISNAFVTAPRDFTVYYQ